MTVCCPLYGGDEGPSICWDRMLTARKAHVCGECHEPITPGTKYEMVTGRWDGSWSSHKTCLLCKEIRNHFACREGWTYSEIWAQLESNFFPDMKAGGPCMEGLSPAAKTVLFERRMAWLEDRPVRRRGGER